MNTENRQTNTLTVKVNGMHCANCEVLVERRFKQSPGVSRVNVDHVSGKAEIVHAGTLDISTLQNAVADDGYTVSAWGEQNSSTSGKSTKFEYLQIGAAFLIFAGLFFALREIDFLPRTFGISDNMGYGLVFLIGLVASVSSCMAVTGGLLVALAARYNDANKQLTGSQRLQPHIYFNVGRIVSYTLLGGAIGAIGSAMTLSPEINGVLIFLASAVMIVLGLQMLNLFPSLGQFQPKMPKFLAHKIHDLASQGSKKGAFVLGASTFFLPCGFTQSLAALRSFKRKFHCRRIDNARFRARHATGLVFPLGDIKFRARQFSALLREVRWRRSRFSWPDEYSIWICAYGKRFQRRLEKHVS